MDWFMETGIRVIVIIAVALALFFISKFIIPPIIKRFIARRMAEEEETEINKRTDTLSSILVSVAGIVIAILAILTILPEFGVNQLSM